MWRAWPMDCLECNTKDVDVVRTSEGGLLCKKCNSHEIVLGSSTWKDVPTH